MNTNTNASAALAGEANARADGFCGSNIAALLLG
jgi:hypothetical protein